MPNLARVLKKVLKIPNAVQLADALRSGRIAPSIAITTRGKTDGAGAQANACMSAMAFANATGIKYVHTPFQSVAHAEEDPATWTQNWEAFFGLGVDEVTADPGATLVNLKSFLDQPQLWKRPDIIIHAEHFHDFCNRQPDSYHAILPRLRAKFEAGGGQQICLSEVSNELIIAVHIRRGDVSQKDAVTASRYTDNQRILTTIKQCQSMSERLGQPYRVNIYSEGRAEDFQIFADIGASLKIGLNPFTTVLGLVNADILITAKSAFSFVAGLLSDRTKIYEPFWTKAPSDWITLNADGLFDENLLSAHLAALK